MTKNRITYGIVFVVLLLFLFVHESRMTYTAVYATLILPLLSFALALFSRHRFIISEKIRNDFITKGEVTTFTGVIKNSFFLPCASAYIDFSADTIGLSTDSKGTHIRIKAFGSKKLEFKITGVYRGVYNIGISSITIYDFLGLFRFKQAHTKKIMLVVTPRVLPISTLSLDSAVQDAILSKNYKQGEDYNIISELRKYQPTDGYKKVHWKASAKRNELISKNFQETERCTTMFFINNSKLLTKSYDAKRRAFISEDALMEAVVSVMFHCHGFGHPISLQYLGNSNEHFSTDFNHLYKEASMISFDTKEIFEAILDSYIRQNKDPMNLYIFTQKMNENILANLKLLSLSGNNVVLFLFNKVKSNIIGELEALNINCVYFEEIALPSED